MPETGINVTSKGGENGSKKSKVLGYFLLYSIPFINSMKLIYIYNQFLA
jgi:hypothetical protein